MQAKAAQSVNFQSSVIQYLNSNAGIRRLSTAESSDGNNHVFTVTYNFVEQWLLPAEMHSDRWGLLFHRPCIYHRVLKCHVIVELKI